MTRETAIPNRFCAIGFSGELRISPRRDICPIYAALTICYTRCNAQFFGRPQWDLNRTETAFFNMLRL